MRVYTHTTCRTDTTPNGARFVFISRIVEVCASEEAKHKKKEKQNGITTKERAKEAGLAAVTFARNRWQLRAKQLCVEINEKEKLRLQTSPVKIEQSRTGCAAGTLAPVRVTAAKLAASDSDDGRAGRTSGGCDGAQRSPSRCSAAVAPPSRSAQA